MESIRDGVTVFGVNGWAGEKLLLIAFDSLASAAGGYTEWANKRWEGWAKWISGVLGLKQNGSENGKCSDCLPLFRIIIRISVILVD